MILMTNVVHPLKIKFETMKVAHDIAKYMKQELITMFLANTNHE